MSRMIHLPVLMLVVSAAGCNREQPPAAQQEAAVSAPQESVAGTAGGSVDMSFVTEQLAMGEKEVGLAQLADERAERPGVKQFAKMLERDHRQATDELRKIAAGQKGTQTPYAEQLKVERERLSRMSGEQFEREFLEEIIADHEDAVRDLEAVVKDENADLRQWAARTLPIVRRHLEEARQLRGGGGRSR